MARRYEYKFVRLESRKGWLTNWKTPRRTPLNRMQKSSTNMPAKDGVSFRYSRLVWEYMALRLISS